MSFRALCAATFVTAVLGLAASAAEAGSITAASGPIMINGKSVTVTAPIELKKGDTVETGTSRATWSSASGDATELNAGTSARAEGAETGLDSLFVRHGTVVATISMKTMVGVAAGWATVDQDNKGTSKVFIDAPEDRKSSEALFRTNQGSAWISYRAFSTWLPERHSVTMSVDATQPETACFRTHQQNADKIEVHKRVSGGTIIAYVPRATSGCFEPAGPLKTRISNDITSLKEGKIEIATRFGGAENRAELGPGTYALIDNTTGAITVLFSAVEFEILEQAVTLTSEFQTLAQSNFTDVD